MRLRVKSWLVTLTAMTLLVVACDPGTDATTTTEAAGDTTTTEGAPAEETTTTAAMEVPEPASLAVGMGLMPPSGVPWTGAGSPGQYVWGQVFDALTFIAPDGSVQPGLATSWTSVDENTWEFTLRDGVSFANGEELNADAVVATFDVLLSEDGRNTYSANVNNYGFVSEVAAVDPTTVRVTTASPNPLTPAALSLAYIVPPDHFAEAGAEGFATAPLGTGPYLATAWSDQSITLEAWDGSWRGVPEIAEIEFINLGDPAARVQALQSGQVQIAHSLIPDQVVTLEAEGFGIFSGTRGSVMSLALIGNQGGPLAEPSVRQAMNYAVDIQTIVDELLLGYSSPGVWAPEGVTGHDPGRDPYPYDPDMARTLLAEAGYGDGFDIVAEVTVGSFPADADIYEAMAGYLAEVGVNVELRQIDFAGEWLPKFLGTDGAFWEGDAFGLSWNAAPLMDAIRPLTFFSCGHANQFFCDEEAQAMISQTAATFEVAERDALLADLLDHTQENPPAIWLVVTPELWGYDSGVSSFAVDNFNIRFEEVSLGG